MNMMMLSQIPAEIKEPGFNQWVVYLIVFLWVAKDLVGFFLKLTGREPTAKREISGTVISQEPVTHAKQSDLDDLEKQVEELRRTNDAQHDAARVAGNHRVQSLSEVIDTEVRRLEDKISEMRQALTEDLREGFDRLSAKMESVAIQAARHDEALPHVMQRIEALQSRYNEAIPALHRRIDEAMKKK